jgi:hypothetical protein
MGMYSLAYSYSRTNSIFDVFAMSCSQIPIIVVNELGMWDIQPVTTIMGEGQGPFSFSKLLK